MRRPESHAPYSPDTRFGRDRSLFAFPAPAYAGERPRWLMKILPGDYREGETPVPIPNTEVKPLNADGTALGWESRSSPGFFILKCHIRACAAQP